MKKSVALLVAFIALLGIVLVASFGTNPQNIITPVYIETIALLDMDGNPIPENAEGEKYLVLQWSSTFVDEESGAAYMRYAFTVELNAGGEPPSREDVLFSYDGSSLDPSDGLAVFEAENGDRSSGVFLIKKVDPSVATYASLTISVLPNDGGNGTGDSCLLIVVFPS